MLPYGRQSVEDDDIEAVLEVLRSDWLTTGPKLGEFEEALAAEVGAKYAVAVSSGTAALHSAAFAAGIGPGDEAITTPLTFAATANCVQYQAGTVVFADVDPGPLNISAARIEEAITPSTKAIIPVDYSGQPADMDEIMALADSHGLVVIEDAAHAIGATYRGRPVGSLATMTIFSFHPVKHITMGEGGAVATDDPELADRMRRFRNHGIGVDHHGRAKAATWFGEMTDLGFNYHVTDIQCALGLSQLQKLPRFVARRREIAERYGLAFAQLPEVRPLELSPDRESSWHLYPVLLDLESLAVDRGQVFRALRAENIGVNVHFVPVPWHPYYQDLGYEKGQWPVAEHAYERLLTLPMWPGMSDQDVDDTVAALRKVIHEYRV